MGGCVVDGMGVYSTSMLCPLLFCVERKIINEKNRKREERKVCRRYMYRCITKKNDSLKLKEREFLSIESITSEVSAIF